MEIVIKNLSKNYGKKTALENVSVTIHFGMYGLLGRNGAGKSTLCRILTGLYRQNLGQIFMDGQVMNHNKRPVFPYGTGLRGTRDAQPGQT